jgi:hypothetical protein
MSEQTLTTRGLGGVLRLQGQPDLPVTVLLRHSSAEPAAVRTVVVLDDDLSLELVVDRALLTSGSVHGDHEGEVQVAVVGAQVELTFADLSLRLALRDVVDVLLASYEAAPTGCEGRQTHRTDGGDVLLADPLASLGRPRRQGRPVASEA